MRNKREVWRVQLVLSKIRASARILLTLPKQDPKRQFQGECLLRKLKKFGIIPQDENTLDRILTLKIQDFLERRLQTIIFKLGLAKSIHHARIIILQRHISIDNKLINIPSYIVRLNSQDKICFFSKSPYGGGNPGRVRKKSLKKI